MRILILFVVAAAAAAQAAITVPPEPTETNAPPGSIVVPPPRGTTTGERPSATATNAPTLPAVPQLVVSLMDGTKLIGSTTLKALTLRSEALGKLSVPLERIASVKFSKDRESVTVTLHNADRLQAGLGDTKLVLTTIFGPVTVPLDKATEMQVRMTGVGCAVEWDILPWVRDTDWPGSRGAPAKIEGDIIELRGQAVRTKQTFTAPIAMEGEFSADDPLQHLERAMIRLIPEGTAPDIYGPAGTVAIILQYETTGQPGGRLYVQLGRQPARRLTREPFAMPAGKPQHLRVEVLADSVRVTLNGGAAEAVSVTLPDKPFHVQLCGWVPDRVWRVRNFTVRR
jgi:hypothetical protein